MAKYNYFQYLRTNKYGKAYLKAMKKATDYDEKHKKSKQEMEQIDSNGGCYTMDKLSKTESKIANDLMNAEDKLNQQHEYFEH